jgi:amidohydrolase
MNLVDELKKYREDLHQIPELAFDLYLTHAYVKDKLETWGYQIEVMAKTGIIAYKYGKTKKMIAFRSDMDALPIEEKTEIKLISKHKGKMHACGHDGHMAMLLAFAHYVSELKELNQSVAFIFQPAEEGPGGARVMIEEGLFEKYPISSIFGIHLYPNLEEGIYGLVDGPMMAQNGEFNIVIKGASAHGAEPQRGVDAIVATSHLITSYQTIVSRNVNPLTSGVITVGTIHGGDARNIIAGEVKLTGTMRSFSQENHDLMKRRMTEINHGFEKIFDVKIDCEILDYYPAVINDHHLFSTLKNSLNPEEFMLIEPMMFAEDFSFYQKKVPGMFVMLGTKNEDLGYIHPLHSCYFNFDEKVLIHGVELYKKILNLSNQI